MAKRRVNNVTTNNAAAPKKEQAKKASNTVPQPPVEEDVVEEKKGFWTRVKESKPVQTGKNIGKFVLAAAAGFAACKIVDKIRDARSSGDDEDSYESEE